MEPIVIESPVKKDYPINSPEWSCRDKEERLYPTREWGEDNIMFTPVKSIEHPFLQKMIETKGILTNWMGEWTFFGDKSYVMFHVYDGFVNLECISIPVEFRKQGSASKVMQAIVDVAKATNTEIRLRACEVTGGFFNRVNHIAIQSGIPKKNKIPVRSLPNWYKKFGFVKVADCITRSGKKGGVNMVFNPQK